MEKEAWRLEKVMSNYDQIITKIEETLSANPNQ